MKYRRIKVWATWMLSLRKHNAAVRFTRVIAAYGSRMYVNYLHTDIQHWARKNARRDIAQVKIIERRDAALRWESVGAG